MAQTMLYVGVACILAAIVGGGFKGLGVEIPVISSTRRQWILGGLGAVVLAGSGVLFFYKAGPSGDELLATGLAAYDSGDTAGALSAFKGAADNGQIEAKWHYGEMLWHGEGVVPDRGRGMALIRESAEGGFAQAQASLAVELSSNRHDDLSEARLWAQRAAAQGNADADYVLALMTKDPMEKVRWLREGASRGHPAVQSTLCRFMIMQLANRAKERASASAEPVLSGDYVEALHWCKEAIPKGDGNAACVASVMLATTERLSDAYTYGLICRRLGLDEALKKEVGDRLGSVESQLSADERLQATQAALAFKPVAVGTERHGHIDWRTVAPGRDSKP